MLPFLDCLMACLLLGGKDLLSHQEDVLMDQLHVLPPGDCIIVEPKAMALLY